MEQLIAKARVLVEALPYISEFRGKTVVVKIGGAALVMLLGLMLLAASLSA